MMIQDTEKRLTARILLSILIKVSYIGTPVGCLLVRFVRFARSFVLPDALVRKRPRNMLRYFISDVLVT